MTIPLIIGISGASASGKTLLAHTILDELGSSEVEIIPEDAYYKDNTHLPLAEREKINYDHPDAIEFDLMYQHLQALRRGETIEIPLYNFTEHVRHQEKRTITQKRIIILEGILLFSVPNIRKMMDIRIFMDTPLDICLIRRMKRDISERDRTMDSVIEQYLATVRPMYIQFIEPSKRYADVIVPRGGENRIAIDMIKAKLKELL